MTPDIPKYALLELERRFLVRAELLPDLKSLPCKVIEDRYLAAGRIRLRKITPCDGGVVVYKLCKKYGMTGTCAEPITNIYLTEAEFESFRSLPGRDLVKRRYRYDYLGVHFSIDEHTGEHAGLYLCECEAASMEALMAVVFPDFAVEEVTGREGYQGANLAGA